LINVAVRVLIAQLQGTQSAQFNIQHGWWKELNDNQAIWVDVPALLITMTSRKSLDFSVYPLPSLFRVQPSATCMSQHWYSKIQHEFYFNALGGGGFSGSDVSFHRSLYAGCPAPLKIGSLSWMSRNTVKDAWGTSGKGCLPDGWVFSHLTFGSKIQAHIPAMVAAGSCYPWCPDGDSQQSQAPVGVQANGWLLMGLLDRKGKPSSSISQFWRTSEFGAWHFPWGIMGMKEKDIHPQF
jgi:hypothetical protein